MLCRNKKGFVLSLVYKHLKGKFVDFFSKQISFKNEWINHCIMKEIQIRMIGKMMSSFLWVLCSLCKKLEQFLFHISLLTFWRKDTSVRAWKIRFSGVQKSALLKASSGESFVPHNFVHLVTSRGTCVHLNVYLVVYQMKYVMERWSITIKLCNFLT